LRHFFQQPFFLIVKITLPLLYLEDCQNCFSFLKLIIFL
jgi:hypothetical protein